MSQVNFDADFQRTILKLCCTNIKFFTDYGIMLEESHFDVHMLRLIFRILSKHILKYERELDKSGLLVAVDDYILSHSVEEGAAIDLRDEVKGIFGSYIGSEQFIIDQLVKFVKRQKMLHALNNSVDILSNDGNYEQVLKLVDDAVSFGSGVDEGLDFESLWNLPEVYRNQYSPEKLVRTLIPGYDEALGGGGAPGEVHCVQAPPKSGKSSFGCYIGSNFLLQGKVVFHVTLELKELDVMIKYAARLSNLNFAELNTISMPEYQSRMERFRKLQPNLYVQYWTNETANTLNIRSWISRIRSKRNVTPDVIIVDYDDLLLPIGGKNDDMYENSGKVYGDLVALGDYFNCPVWTFAQPKREAWDLPDRGELIQSYHLAHSAKKAHKCYSLSSLNFKSGSNVGVLYADLVRRGHSNFKVPLQRDLSRCLFHEPESKK